MGFKVGDKVRLTGESWAKAPAGVQEGSVHEVIEVSLLGDTVIEDGWFILPEDGWGAELVEEEPPLAPWEKELLWTPFEQSVRRHTDRIANILLAKNKAYGDSALNPVRVFSKADREEQLYVRIDDKISRIQRGTDFATEDTIDDLIGYLILLKIAKESA